MTDVLGSDARLYWETRAEEYDRNHGITRVQTKLTERGLELLEPEGGLFLDLGCGTGISTRIVSERGFPVVGLDISFHMVRIARRKGPSVVVGDFMRLPFRDSSFRNVISVSTLQWITGRNQEEIRSKYSAAAREIHRVLGEDGRAMIQFFPATEGEMEIAQKEFKKAGFKGYLIEDADGRRFILLIK